METRLEIAEYVKEQTDREELQESTIEDWHKNGLIPRPNSKGEYRDGTKEQAVVASKLLQKRKDMKWALMEMWLAGWINDFNGLENVKHLLRSTFNEHKKPIEQLASYTDEPGTPLDNLKNGERPKLSIKDANTGTTHDPDVLDVVLSIASNILNNNPNIDNECSYTIDDFHDRYREDAENERLADRTYELTDDDEIVSVIEGRKENSLIDEFISISGMNPAMVPSDLLSSLASTVNAKALIKTVKELTGGDLELLRWQINGLRLMLQNDPINTGRVLTNRYYLDWVKKYLYEPTSLEFVVLAIYLLRAKHKEIKEIGIVTISEPQSEKAKTTKSNPVKKHQSNRHSPSKAKR